MKQTCLLLCMLLIAGFARGQAQEGTVEFQKSQQPAAVIELPYTPDVVNSAMNDYLSKKGRSRGTDIKGFTTYRNTQAAPTEGSNADLYFKIERKSRSDKQTTVISLLLTMPREGAVTGTNVRYLDMNEAKTYLNDLAPAITAYNLELQIKDQNAIVIKAESRNKSLSDDGNDLEKKRLSIEGKIKDNKNDQQAQTAEVDNQKQKLAVLVGQRK
ncbi:hypothetical protein ACTHGU_01115 [Chitinophagaceae bacterium MMS25-I14]